MKTQAAAWGLILSLVSAIAAAESGTAGSAEATPQANPPAFEYRPPDRGAPQRRVGGGTRSIDQLLVLTPPHVGHTSKPQPRLFWFLSPGFGNALRFRLGLPGEAPILELLLPPNRDGGVQSLDLAEHEVHLQPGRVYQWGVLLEPEPHQRWPVLASQGRIALAPAPPALLAADPGEQPFIAAREGLWYDALAGVSRLLETAPEADLWRLRRAELLEQGGLWSVAGYERELASGR